MPTPPSLQPYSPKYEAEDPAPLEPHYPLEGEVKPPIKLTLRMHQPLRKARATISPGTEQIVNYIDDVTTFLTDNDIPTEEPPRDTKVTTRFG